jgi:hypothetical protein
MTDEGITTQVLQPETIYAWIEEGLGKERKSEVGRVKRKKNTERKVPYSGT